MLNEYHLQFLRLFDEHHVRYLVIGGQARFVYFGTPTRDLDVWVDISQRNRPALDNCLAEWKARHPVHTMLDFSFPLALRPNVQIKFPDADALFLGSDAEPAEILAQDGIDILTSIGDADFEIYFARSTTKAAFGIDVTFLSLADLETISPRS
jgi:hypothetical protein